MSFVSSVFDPTGYTPLGGLFTDRARYRRVRAACDEFSAPCPVCGREQQRCASQHRDREAAGVEDAGNANVQREQAQQGRTSQPRSRERKQDERQHEELEREDDVRQQDQPRLGVFQRNMQDSPLFGPPLPMPR